MSTHTTYFCDHCNYDRDISSPEDAGHAVNYGELPTYDGWAEFTKPYTDSLGYGRTEHYHVCAHCLADPEFNPDTYKYGTIAEWDKESHENLEKGRAHAEMYQWALEHLGTRDRWGYRGVRQIFDNNYGYWFGPKMEDGRFMTSDPVRSPLKKDAA